MLPLVVGAVTLFAVLVGGMRALTRTVAEQASAAAMDAAKKATDSLYERLWPGRGIVRDWVPVGVRGWAQQRMPSWRTW